MSKAHDGKRQNVKPAGFAILVIFSGCCLCTLRAQTLHHFVFVNRDREALSDPAFLETAAFEGAQVKYTWRELEPERDGYDFSDIRHDLKFLTGRGKRLFLQLQDVSFDSSIMNVPEYLLKEAEFHGGVSRQVEIIGNQRVSEGWVARRWDPAVQHRLFKLFDALGSEFDGTIEGINLPETAIDVGNDPALFPSGFSFVAYKDAVIENEKALKRAFLNSAVIIYSNFMPGDRLSSEDHPYLRSVYRAARESGFGLGGPDLLPHKKGQMTNGYRFIRECGGVPPAGIAVQEGNYSFIDPTTEKQVTIEGLIDFAKNYLRVSYVFWSMEEPYYSRDLVPYLRGENPK
jgi:hypothetical protein